MTAPPRHTYARHEEATAVTALTPEALFRRLDGPARLGSHMEKPSAMMMGGILELMFARMYARWVWLSPATSWPSSPRSWKAEGCSGL